MCRLRYSVPAVCRRRDLRPPTIRPSRLSLLLFAVLLGLCALRCAGLPTFQAPQGMGPQKVLKLLWWRRLRTLRAHDVPPVSNVPDWNTNLLTRGVHREGQHQSRTAGAHFPLDLSSTHALPLLCQLRNVRGSSRSRPSGNSWIAYDKKGTRYTFAAAVAGGDTPCGKWSDHTLPFASSLGAAESGTGRCRRKTLR